MSVASGRDGTLAGKRALVVGAGSGIGRAVVDAFIVEGAVVGALELDGAKCDALAAERPACVVSNGDATSLDDNRRAVAAVVGTTGALDVLVNCVGVFDFYLGLQDLDDNQLMDGFDELLRTNVLSHLLSVKAALPALVEAQGSVVLTVSTSGFRAGRGGVLYVASKFGARGVVVALARELAPRVRVNGVAPGGTVGTDLRGARTLGLDQRRLDDVPGREQELRARTPLGVALTPADHAASYVFLASDRARGITGTFLHPDGGSAVS